MQHPHRNAEGIVVPATSAPDAADLPVHFFTIVLNGEPFIRYHAGMMASLPFRWHWHIVEGVAALRHDTAWSNASGGRIPEDSHQQGRSNDGTSEYLDELARDRPGQVTLYRKPPGEFWDGKRAMVNAPLAHINEECLLWQIDADELWTAEQVATMRARFLAEPQRKAAYYWCWFFVTPDKVISTRCNYAQNPDQEWLRTWRYRPGDRWVAHEPPTLARPVPGQEYPVDLAGFDPFSQDETEALGAVFHHFAYAHEAQARFKERYYGYAGAVQRWHQLLAAPTPGFLADYLPWVHDRTVFDTAALLGVQPLARPDPSGNWRFGATETTRPQEARRVTPRIVIDGLCWQHHCFTLGRFWQRLLEEWVRAGQGDHFVVLDRAGTAPRLPGVHYRTIAAQDPTRTGEDSLHLERIASSLGADLFVSTLHSAPIETPSACLLFDLRPENPGGGPYAEFAREQARAICHASAHLVPSEAVAEALLAAYPYLTRQGLTIIPRALSPQFLTANAGATSAPPPRPALPQRYVLVVGDRSGPTGYRDTLSAFQAVELAARRGGPKDLICVGGLPEIEPELAAAAPSIEVRRLAPEDNELRQVYSKATALLYPDQRDLWNPILLEAQACGCPIVGRLASGAPATAPKGTLLHSVTDADVIAGELLRIIEKPLAVTPFTVPVPPEGTVTPAAQAHSVIRALLAACARGPYPSLAGGGKVWRELRSLQTAVQAFTAKLGESDSADDRGPNTVPRRISRELEHARRQIAEMKSSPFWRLRTLWVRALRAIHVLRRS
jgi:glycosyltransferase involved in cell wall biosynthesis